MLKKGDPCYVRYMGKIQKVKYLGKSEGAKNWHWVKFKDGTKTMVHTFVCMTGLNKGKDNG